MQAQAGVCSHGDSGPFLGVGAHMPTTGPETAVSRLQLRPRLGEALCGPHMFPNFELLKCLDNSGG